MKRQLPEEIETPRLLLSAPVADDAGRIFSAYAQDQEVCLYMTWKPHESEATVCEFVQDCIHDWVSGSRFAYIIRYRDSNLLIGMLDARVQEDVVDIGYVLARQHWGAGLMPEAIQGLAVAALSNQNINRIQATRHVDNNASQRALEKSGFIQEGRLARHLIHPNISPEPGPCYMYSRFD
ncbi:MAG: GNAT family N-acetyltransferase [Gammaproteobacteria bacterium]|jgi:RimJ/RimL family protein N-acetyltransferase|nr:GNAT family N-acetyltransferase [Chromatiales bacterium]MDP6416081.1 GNAT family N-acetyltransferase [Gammaproteobacteria bacterium]MDP6674886.1 GNAT family N-acetyltransferase [Gammaproteobacteria bacterium]